MQLKDTQFAGGRTPEQLRNHYEVEKAIAARLKQASREERKVIYETMYDELFAKVPDHPRLTRRENQGITKGYNQKKFKLIQPFINPSTVFMEFAPGDCRFAMEVCQSVQFVYAVDISDQRGQGVSSPSNFELIVYDGYNLNLAPNSIDVVFSDQLIEHIHPEDTESHFSIVRNLLKPGGAYVLRTPHRFTGPHDISRYFSDEPEGFHLKEWTYTELGQLLKRLGYSNWWGYWYAESKDTLVRLPFSYFTVAETLVSLSSKQLRKSLSRFAFTSSGIVIAAIK